MDPQTQQSIDYIRQQLAAGQTEAAVRDGFARSGWPQPAVDTLFSQYYAAQATGQPAIMSPPQLTSPKQSAGVSTKRSLPRFFIPIAAAVVVLLVIVLGLVLLLHSSTGNKTASKLGQAALTESAADTARKNDVAMLAGALGNYLASHGGNLPLKTASGQGADTLLLCGSDCAPINEVPVSLSHYKNTTQAVSFHAYAKDLKVPDAETVYIVNNAACTGAKLGASNQPSRVAILYALSGQSLQQQCQGL